MQYENIFYSRTAEKNMNVFMVESILARDGTW